MNAPTSRLQHIVGVHIVIAFAFMSGCQTTPPVAATDAVKKPKLTDDEYREMAFYLAAVEQNASAISDLEHRFAGMKKTPPRPDAMRLSPDEYATFRRQQAFEAAMKELKLKSDAIHTELYEFVNDLRADPVEVFRR